MLGSVSRDSDPRQLSLLWTTVSNEIALTSSGKTLESTSAPRPDTIAPKHSSWNTSLDNGTSHVPYFLDCMNGSPRGCQTSAIAPPQPKVSSKRSKGIRNSGLVDINNQLPFYELPCSIPKTVRIPINGQHSRSVAPTLPCLSRANKGADVSPTIPAEQPLRPSRIALKEIQWPSRASHWSDKTTGRPSRSNHCSRLDAKSRGEGECPQQM